MATGLVGLSSKKTASILESIQPFGDLRFLALVRTRQPKQSRAAHTLPVRDLKGLSHPVTFSSLVLFSGSARNSRRNFQLIDSDRFIQSKTIPISKDLSTPDMHKPRTNPELINALFGAVQGSQLAWDIIAPTLKVVKLLATWHHLQPHHLQPGPIRSNKTGSKKSLSETTDLIKENFKKQNGKVHQKNAKIRVLELCTFCVCKIIPIVGNQLGIPTILWLEWCSSPTTVAYRPWLDDAAIGAIVQHQYPTKGKCTNK